MENLKNEAQTLQGLNSSGTDMYLAKFVTKSDIEKVQSPDTQDQSLENLMPLKTPQVCKVESLSSLAKFVR